MAPDPNDDPQDPLAQLKALKAAQAPPSDDPLEQLKALKGGDPNAQLHADYQSGKLRRDIANKNEAEQAQIPDHPLATAGLEALETPLAGVPGGQGAMSIARRLTSRGPLAEDQNAVNAETSGGGFAGTLGRGIGGLASSAVLPASGLKAGAILGGADQLLNNDPTSGVAGRLARGAGGALVGGAIGGAADRLLTAGRSALVPSATKQTLALQDARTAANQALDKPSYATAAEQGKRYYVDLSNREHEVANGINRGLSDLPKALPAPGQSAVAQQEARAGFANHDFTNGPAPTLEQAASRDFTATTPPSEPFHGSGLHQRDFTQERPVVQRAANDVSVRQSPAPQLPQPLTATPRATGANAITEALNSPTVAPYAKLARSFEQNQNADDATILRETYKLMSEAQGKKLALTSAGDFAAAPAAQLQSIGIAKQRLRDAAGDVMPDFDAAVDQHRILSGELSANKQGYGLGQKLQAGPPSAKQIGQLPKPNGLVPDPEMMLSRAVPQMTQPEAAQASRGLLASVKASGQGGSYNPLKAFGMLGSEPTNAALHTIDAKAGNHLPSAIQRAILALTQQKGAETSP